MHLYKNPLLDWAIRGEGEAPSLFKAKQLLLILNESDTDAKNLLINLEDRHKQALKIKADIEKGIENVTKYVNEHPKNKEQGPAQES
jgi:hypothetical protein